MKKSTKTYEELVSFKRYEDRFRYLKLSGVVGGITFGGFRELNQILYHSDEWRKVRREVILRDSGFDLAHVDYPIGGKIYIHHINPITVDDILKQRYCVFDLSNLISVSFKTHNAIHYGDDRILNKDYTPRREYDTCPWRN